MVCSSNCTLSSRPAPGRLPIWSKAREGPETDRVGWEAPALERETGYSSLAGNNRGTIIPLSRPVTMFLKERVIEDGNGTTRRGDQGEVRGGSKSGSAWARLDG